jgi:hypothetical protein
LCTAVLWFTLFEKMQQISDEEIMEHNLEMLLSYVNSLSSGDILTASVRSNKTEQQQQYLSGAATLVFIDRQRVPYRRYDSIRARILQLSRECSEEYLDEWLAAEVLLHFREPDTFYGDYHVCFKNYHMELETNNQNSAVLTDSVDMPDLE